MNVLQTVAIDRGVEISARLLAVATPSAIDRVIQYLLTMMRSASHSLAILSTADGLIGAVAPRREDSLTVKATPS
jgi:hypothetical protein